jgi:hypothetical protein
MAADFRNVQVYIYGYQDKYHALPGDDSKAAGNVGVTSSEIGNANGKIDGIWNSTSTADESLRFWLHIRKAGLATGSTTLAADATFWPLNADNGRIGVQSGSTPSITVLSGVHVVCSDQILGKFAKQLDVNLDNGDPATGAMMVKDNGTTGTSLVVGSGTGVAATALGDVVDTHFTTVCMAF